MCVMCACVCWRFLTILIAARLLLWICLLNQLPMYVHTIYVCVGVVGTYAASGVNKTSVWWLWRDIYNVLWRMCVGIELHVGSESRLPTDWTQNVINNSMVLFIALVSRLINRIWRQSTNSRSQWCSPYTDDSPTLPHTDHDSNAF